MKKYLFALAAATAALLSSCAKEETPAAVESNPGAFTITARIDNDATKTHYVEGASSASLFWNAGDRFKLMVYKDDEGKASNYYSFQADADAAGSEATFSIVAGSMDLTTYKPAGYAVYPNTLATGGVKDAYTVTLSGEYTVASGTDLSKVAVPMIGVPTDAADANTYEFSPAVGVLKVQLTNVPAAARKLVLKAVDSDNVSGVFPLDAVNGFRMADAGSAGHTVTVNFPSQTEGSDIAVYMPIPVGSISAGAVFEVQDEAGAALCTTPATVKAINVAKGQLIPIKAINVNEWTTLGTGKFVDNFLWHHMGVATSTTDEVGYVDVTIQQNVVNTNKYRVANPYAAILTSVGKTQDASHSDYLEFTIADANTVDFVTTNTGFDSGNGIVSIEDADGAYNKIVLGTEDDPQIVQLAPKYNSTGSFLYTRNTRDNLIRIAFPGVYEEHYATISISGSADMTSGINFVNHNIIDNYYRKVTISVSNNTLYSYYTSQGNQTLPNTCVSKTDASGNIAKASLGVDNPSYDFKTSGVKYVFWSAYASNGTTVLFQGCKKFYFICASDIDSYIGQYDMIHSTGNTTLTLSVSDNLTIGNVQLSEVAGINGSLHGIYTPADHKLIFSRAYQYPFVDNTYIYSKGKNDLNLYLNYDGTSDEDYGNAEWGLITLDKNDLVVEIEGSSTTTYEKMRGNKAIVAP